MQEHFLSEIEERVTHPSRTEAPASQRGIRALRILFVLCAFTMAACHSHVAAEVKSPQIGWSPIESWSGHGNTQTQEFDVSSGLFRIKWTTTNEQVPGRGTLHVFAYSSVSGRPIADAIDAHGVGSGIAYVRDDPRPFYLVVESSGLDWKLTAEEGTQGEPQ